MVSWLLNHAYFAKPLVKAFCHREHGAPTQSSRRHSGPASGEETEVASLRGNPNPVIQSGENKSWKHGGAKTRIAVSDFVALLFRASAIGSSARVIFCAFCAFLRPTKTRSERQPKPENSE